MSEDIVVNAPKHWLNQRGFDLIRSFEGCALKAYPDPGSDDGNPWTIGWGSTGPDIKAGTVWTQPQADDRFETELGRYVQQVREAIGNAPTTNNQFDALVSFHYNTGQIKHATLTKKHVAGDYAGAAREFDVWIHNDGRLMKGLVKRRAAERALYERSDG